jgi:antitoxin ParD1/3/4
MPITLQPEQEQFIQTQLASGRYTNATEVIAEALQLLEKRNHYDRWVEELRNKIDIAAAELDRGEGIDVVFPCKTTSSSIASLIKT